MKALFYFSILLMGMISCSKEQESPRGKGSLCVQLEVNPSVEILSKSTDVTTYTLEVLRDGVIVKRLAPIGIAPAPIELPSGGYEVRAYSKKFLTPAFDTPVYGGSTSALIAVSSETKVSIHCTQTNAGVKIHYTDAFKANHKTYSTTIRQIEGQLTYTPVDETNARIGYFLPASATIIVVADGMEYEQILTLDPQKLYTITVNDAPQPVAGELTFEVTVSTEVIEEDVEVIFPSGVVDYSEMLGGTKVVGEVVVSSFKEWSNKKATYVGSGVSVTAAYPSSGYTNASGVNCLIFKSSGSYFTISGLNTSTAATDMVLSFGCRSVNVNYNLEHLKVSVSSDGVSFTPLLIEEGARPANKNWARISISENIPKAKNLTIRFDCSSTSYLVDDVTLKTM